MENSCKADVPRPTKRRTRQVYILTSPSMKAKTKPIHIIINRIIIQVVYDRGCEKEEGFEFHLTPVITLAKAIEPEGTGYGVSLEWGFWAINLGYFPAKYFK